MNSVAFMGIKGGNGSTTSAHLCCLGAAWSNRPSYFLHTDMREPAQVDSKRPYKYLDAREVNYLTETFNKLTEASGDHLVVVDSGGNRPKFDEWIAKAVDLVIIPTDLDPESVKLAVQHAENLKDKSEVKILVRGALKLGKHDQEIFERIPSELLLGKVPVVKAISGLKGDDDNGWSTPETKVNNLARSVHGLVFDYFNPPIRL